MRRNKKVRYLVLASFCFYLIALANDSASMFVLCWALLSLVGVAWVLSRLAVSGLGVERGRVPRRTFAGDPLPTALQVVNRGGLPKSNILLRDPWRNETLNLEAAPTYLIQWLESNQKVPVPESGVAPYRGRYRLGPVQAVASDPWGIFEVHRSLGEEQAVLVYPRPVELPRFFLRRPQGVESDHPLARRPLEAGLDFHGVREYQPGDDLRRVHWKAVAHTGRLFIREFEKNWPIWATVVLDLHRERQFGQAVESTVECGVGVAASVCRRLLQQGYRLRFLACDGALIDRRAEAGEAELFPILEFLAGATGRGRVPAERLLASHLASLPAASCLILITASTAPELAEMLASLGRRGLQVLVIALVPHSFLPASAGQQPEAGGGPGGHKGWWLRKFARRLRGFRAPEGSVSPPSPSSEELRAAYRDFVDHLRAAGVTVCPLHRGDDPAVCLQV